LISGKNPCVQFIQANSRISRQQLAQFLNIPTGSPRNRLIRVLGYPYCLVKAVVEDQQDAYPMGFDPATWLIVRYKDGYYTGYDFKYGICGMGGLC
jgi:hypothetical protein